MTRRRAIAALGLLLSAAALAGPGRAAPLTEGAGTRAGAACETRITLRNETARRIQEVFLRPAGAAAWGRDLLGDAVLRPGQQAEIATPASGPMDLMVLAADGTTRALWRVEACAVRRVTITADFALRAE
ncbi:MAG TPA: hypothetical protein VD970_14605 [Acetobacteraceae bacterium]|nr:hypothetical protein [Acetobacteraceae bacterium]